MFCFITVTQKHNSEKTSLHIKSQIITVTHFVFLDNFIAVVQTHGFSSRVPCTICSWTQIPRDFDEMIYLEACSCETAGYRYSSANTLYIESRFHW